MMKLWRSWLSRIVVAACLNGAIVLSQDVAEEEAAPADELINLTLVVSEDAAEDANTDGKTPPSNPDAPRFFAFVEHQNSHWIGLVCVPPADALRTQLDLASDVGLLVEEVIPDGPAMKAGILKHDLLFSVTSTTKQPAEPQVLKNLPDLTNQIQIAMGNPIKIDLLRRGRKQTLELVPVERPKSLPSDAQVVLLGDGNRIVHLTRAPGGPLDQVVLGPMVVQGLPALPNGVKIEFQPVEGPLEKLTVKKDGQTWVFTPSELDKLPEDLRPLVSQHVMARQHAAIRSAHVSQATGGGGGHAVAFYHPGVVMSPTRALPADVTVTIVRHGADPAAVTVKKGDQSWEATEKDLGKLPPEVRMFAESSLRGHTPSFAVHGREPHAMPVKVQQYAPPGAGAVFRNRPLPGSPLGVTRDARDVERATQRVRAITEATQTEAIQRDIERQLKELSEQVAKLRDAVEKSQPK